MVIHPKKGSSTSDTDKTWQVSEKKNKKKSNVNWGCTLYIKEKDSALLLSDTNPLFRNVPPECQTRRVTRGRLVGEDERRGLSQSTQANSIPPVAEEPVRTEPPAGILPHSSQL